MKNVIVVVGIIIVLLIGLVVYDSNVKAKEREEQRVAAEAEQKRVEEENARQLKLAEEKRIAQEKEAEKLRKLQEVKLLEQQKEKNRIQNRLTVIPVEISNCENLLQELKDEYTVLSSKIEEQVKVVTINESKYKAAEAKAEALRRQEGDSRATKNRREGQYNSTFRDSGVRSRDTIERQEKANRLTRGLSEKSGEAEAMAEREKIKFENSLSELNEMKTELTNLENKIDNEQNKISQLKSEDESLKDRIFDPNSI